jgi:hypothetical protein
MKQIRRLATIVALKKNKAGGLYSSAPVLLSLGQVITFVKEDETE